MKRIRNHHIDAPKVHLFPYDRSNNSRYPETEMERFERLDRQRKMSDRQERNRRRVQLLVKPLRKLARRA